MNDELVARAQAFVDRKYVTRSDERQKSMGLAYVEAERQDLTREIARFTQAEIMLASRQEVSVDALAQEIRRVDGSNSLGAGALAEALLAKYSITNRTE